MLHMWRAFKKLSTTESYSSSAKINVILHFWPAHTEILHITHKICPVWLWCCCTFAILLSVRISICTVQDTNNLGCILWLKCSHLSALSNDDPVKSKKLRYSDATNWLNSLLQEKETRKRGIVGMNENCFIPHPFPYSLLVHTQTLTSCPGVVPRHSAWSPPDRRAAWPVVWQHLRRRGSRWREYPCCPSPTCPRCPAQSPSRTAHLWGWHH